MFVEKLVVFAINREGENSFYKKV